MKNNQTTTEAKQLKDFKAEYNCRFHPTNWWHEVGCSHREWTKDELQDALNKAKQSLAYIFYLAHSQEDREGKEENG